MAGMVSWLIRCVGEGRWWPRFVAVLMAVELLHFAHGYQPQCDRALYYPRLPALEAVNAAGAGRTLCVGCLPANLHVWHGLRDIRGYDAIDPLPILDLLDLARDPRDQSPSYARTQSYLPRVQVSAEGKLKLSPLLDMLNVRYLVFRMELPMRQKPLWSKGGYVVYENTFALDRVYIPARVHNIEQEDLLLRELSRDEFDPRQTAFVPGAPKLSSSCRGMAEITSESPDEITVAARMETDGLLVLADQWAEGWSVAVDGQPAEVVRVNHALKGVILGTGEHSVVFRYDPPGLFWGLICMGIAVATLVAGHTFRPSAFLCPR
jgi:hypothetical protein